MQPCGALDRSPGHSISAAPTSPTPVALAFALVHADGTADLFVEGEKIGDDVRAISATASGSTSGMSSNPI